MKPEEIAAWLARSLDDRRFSRSERQALSEFAASLGSSIDRESIRHSAFEVARAALGQADDLPILVWLEEVTRVLRKVGKTTDRPAVAEAFFSPGDDCPRAITRLLANASRTADICVFTITDDRVSDAILDAHRRAVAVRIITDNAKAEDEGSDVERFERSGIPTRVDQSPFHMHHKFAILDGAKLLTGSYNWTRGAGQRQRREPDRYQRTTLSCALPCDLRTSLEEAGPVEITMLPSQKLSRFLLRFGSPGNIFVSCRSSIGRFDRMSFLGLFDPLYCEGSLMVRHPVWLSMILLSAIGSAQSDSPSENVSAPPVGPTGGGSAAKSNADSSRVPDGPVVQGITPQERQEFYHLPEGSELYPLAWIKVMKDPETKDFFLKNIERFGMLPNPDDPDGLPIGVSRGSSRGLEAVGDMIGVDCEACHVAQLTYQGKTLRMNGGPSLISMDRFYGSLFGAAGAMLRDPVELAAFYERLAQQSGGSVNPNTRTLLTLLARILNKKASNQTKPAENALTEKFQGLIAKIRNDAGSLKANLRETHDQLQKKVTEKYKADIDSLIESINAPDLSGVVKEAFPDVDKIRTGVEDLATKAALLQGRVEFLLKIRDLHAAAATTTVGGPGRSDAFGVISNMVMPNEGIKLSGPVSYPYIWSLGPEYETIWFHYDGNTTSLLQRNVGQAVGLGAAFDKNTMSSTIKIRDMDRLQQITRKLRPPEWPSDLLPAIDTASAERGATVYKAHCLECHADAFEPDHEKREKWVDYKQVGTNPNRIDNFQINVQKTAENPAGTPYIKALAAAAEALTQAAYKDSNITPAEQKAMEPGEVIWVAKKAYMARPLVAIWATAPYLHNGSVPTLNDLLKRAADQPKYFEMGNREYDPVNVGYVCKVLDKAAEATPPLWTFDTTITGNGNGGHEYGADLTTTQKKDLIEYLKGNYIAKAK